MSTLLHQYSSKSIIILVDLLLALIAIYGMKKEGSVSGSTIDQKQNTLRGSSYCNTDSSGSLLSGSLLIGNYIVWRDSFSGEDINLYAKNYVTNMINILKCPDLETYGFLFYSSDNGIIVNTWHKVFYIDLEEKTFSELLVYDEQPIYSMSRVTFDKQFIVKDELTQSISVLNLQ